MWHSFVILFFFFHSNFRSDDGEEDTPLCVFTIAYNIKSWYFKVTIPKVLTSTLSSKYLRYVARY